MKDAEKVIDKRDKWRFSIFPVLRYNFLFCSLIIVIIALSGIWQTIRHMEDSVRISADNAQKQISYRVEQSLKILHALAARTEYNDPNIPYVNKIGSLDQSSEQLGYMMIRYVDANMNVYSTRGSTSLASRDYMQRLFYGAEPQITDSFAAGADGRTLNYTIAVPLWYQNEVSGSLFCAIYFDEIVDLLNKVSDIDGVELALAGSKNQLMSASDQDLYGTSYLEHMHGSTLFQVTPNQLETKLLNHKAGDFWHYQGGNLYYTLHLPIEHTKWNVIATENFWKVYYAKLPGLLLIMLTSIILCAGLILLVHRYMQRQMQVVDLLLQSVQELEKKIYQNDRPDDVDFKRIIQLTSTGLSDGLTGVVTRTVFLNQLHGQVSKLQPDKVSALCFIDLDDLKKLNDTYGHGVGDVALKSIGYVLREYEKRYEGLVGRYGGDEFVLLLANLDDENELHDVLAEIVLRLKADIGEHEQAIPIHCSVGVAIRRPDEEIDRWISKADEGLYFVKQNGKGFYKIYQD